MGLECMLRCLHCSTEVLPLRTLYQCRSGGYWQVLRLVLVSKRIVIAALLTLQTRLKLQKIWKGEVGAME